MGEVELDDEGAEENVAEKHAHEGGRGGLHAGPVVGSKPPLLERDLKAEAANRHLQDGRSALAASSRARA